MSKWLGPNTLFRRRTPTNEQASSNFINMAFDHSQQKAVLPDRKPRVLVENTQGVRSDQGRTMNRDGRPFALRNVQIGGSPDDPGTRK